MSALYIDRKGADVDIEGETIVVRVDGKRTGTAPLRALERVVMRGGGRIATRLVSRLNQRGIGLVLLASRNKEPASVLSPAIGDAERRLAQYALAADDQRCNHLARDLVRAKISGQARLLHESKAHNPKIRHAIERIDKASADLASSEALPNRHSLRGIEGAASAAYFSGFTNLFADALAFTHRNRRPPRDPVNVCLSLGYTILHQEAVQQIAARGLDPAVGIYHDPRKRRESLACDLAEPLRPWIDRFTWHLFADQTLSKDHFTQNGASCRMGKAGRKAFYRRFEDEAPVMRRLLGRAATAYVKELASVPAQLPSPSGN